MDSLCGRLHLFLTKASKLPRCGRFRRKFVHTAPIPLCFGENRILHNGRRGAVSPVDPGASWGRLGALRGRKLDLAKTPLTPPGIGHKIHISARGIQPCAPFRERRRKRQVQAGNKAPGRAQYTSCGDNEMNPHTGECGGISKNLKQSQTIS